jgi:hypothetical protein
MSSTPVLHFCQAICPQTQLTHLFMGFAASHDQLVIDLIIDLLSGVVINIVELGRFKSLGQKHVRALRPAARLVQNQACRIELAGQHGYRMQHLFQNRAF